MTNDVLLVEMGIRIQQRRKELNLTQEQLAERAEVSVQMISNLELGKKAIRPENLVKICDHLHVSADYLLRGIHTSAENAKLVEKLDLLPERYRKPIEALILSLDKQ